MRPVHRRGEFLLEIWRQAFISVGVTCLDFFGPFQSWRTAPVEVLNDINGELVNLYRVMQHHVEEFVPQFKSAISSRQVFKWHQQSRPETLTDIQRAARFYYLQQHAFGGKVDGQTFDTATTAPSINLVRIEEVLSAAHLRLAGAKSKICRGTSA
ncbi:hypothetical protein Busp01_43270 [Trinickia caryophylli]|uniref:site-specific DNA-methyltransferase (adenine-specific) n=1 Tax=Trinickia caryophylli TaxID=28094 RepID=A0A1X7F3T9_TRICW|nr:hypothetical protein Busp01_43270 [Trinickia caryophylli]SMF44809.1 D12 class N6 adenine-specific DNA methyltransferase [Trinickia caryophylli]